MKILLVEGAPGSGAAVESELRAAGHVVVGCESSDPSMPCRGLDVFGDCPVESGDIDVAVACRADVPVATSERGALCAARHRIPVVVTGDPRHAISFGPNTHFTSNHAVATCEAATRSAIGHEAAIRRDLLIAGVLDPDDVDGPGATVRFDVHREPRRLKLTVTTRAGHRGAASVVRSAVEALRRFDPHITVIDVAHDTFEERGSAV